MKFALHRSPGFEAYCTKCSYLNNTILNQKSPVMFPDLQKHWKVSVTKLSHFYQVPELDSVFFLRTCSPFHCFWKKKFRQRLQPLLFAFWVKLCGGQTSYPSRNYAYSKRHFTSLSLDNTQISNDYGKPDWFL